MDSSFLPPMHTFSSPFALEASPVAAVNLQTISSPSIPHFLPLMLCTFPLLLPWILPPWMHQLFPYPILIKLFLWNLQTQIIFISKCRWNHISLDKVFSTLLMALCHVLLLVWLLLIVFLFRLITLFGNSRTNLF
jgi:hypothetical protein